MWGLFSFETTSFFSDAIVNIDPIFDPHVVSNFKVESALTCLSNTSSYRTLFSAPSWLRFTLFTSNTNILLHSLSWHQYYLKFEIGSILPTYVREEPANRLSLRNNRLKFKSLGELRIILEKSIEEYTSNEWKQNRKMSTWNWLGLKSPESWLTKLEIP